LADELLTQLEEPVIELVPFRFDFDFAVLFGLLRGPSQDGGSGGGAVRFGPRGWFFSNVFFLGCHNYNCSVRYN